MKKARYISALLACILISVSTHAVKIRREPGQRLPEYIQPTDLDDPALWLRPTGSVFTRAIAAPGDYSLNDIPRTGTIDYPLVLVDFSDLRFMIQDKDSLVRRYDRIFNEYGYTDTTSYFFHGEWIYGATGSVSDYFRDQSYGQFIPRFNIIGPIHLSKSYAYYGKGEYDSDAHIEQMIREVCDSIIKNRHSNLSGYADNGIIYQFSVIYAGRGENYNGSDPNTIWPQASELYFTRKDTLIYGSGIRSMRYACSCELLWDSDSIPDGIGTFCHEFSHTLGLPDFYNTSNNSGTDDEDNAAMGYWSLMDYGNYENQGLSPVGYTAFEKYSLGWMDLEEITAQGVYVLDDISRKPVPGSGVHSAYRLNTGNDDQFIILENHRRTGWYKFHKAEGLMVTAVDYDRNRWMNNTINNFNPKRYRILPADNDYSRNSNAGDLFPHSYTDSEGDHVTNSITTTGTPQLKAGSSYPSFNIYGISRQGDRIEFTAAYDLPSRTESPQREDISITIEDGLLKVTAPSGSTVTVFDISGKAVSRSRTTSAVWQTTLPGPGIWIVDCAGKTRKVRY